MWFQEQFQCVVDKIFDLDLDIKVIQVGSVADPLLQGVHDLRGMTDIRETASILSQSICFIGTVGFLMHLANSVSCKSVIIFGGREHSWQSGYKENYNIDTLIDSAPCWKWNDCDRNLQCMREINVDQVFAGVQQMLSNCHG